MATEIKGYTCKHGTFHMAPQGFEAMVIGIDRSATGKDASVGVLRKRVPLGDGTSLLVVIRTFPLLRWGNGVDLRTM